MKDETVVSGNLARQGVSTDQYEGGWLGWASLGRVTMVHVWVALGQN